MATSSRCWLRERMHKTRHVELAQALGIKDGINFGDLALRDNKAPHGTGFAAVQDDDAGSAVDERRSGDCRGIASGAKQRATCHGHRTAYRSSCSRAPWSA